VRYCEPLRDRKAGSGFRLGDRPGGGGEQLGLGRAASALQWPDTRRTQRLPQRSQKRYDPVA
jgi:hypothetical protein